MRLVGRRASTDSPRLAEHRIMSLITGPQERRALRSVKRPRGSWGAYHHLASANLPPAGAARGSCTGLRANDLPVSRSG